VAFDLQDAFEEYYSEEQRVVPCFAASDRGGFPRLPSTATFSRRFATFADTGIPVTTVVTGVNMHDSQLAIQGYIEGKGRVYIRGIHKASFHLFSGVICLAVVKILQHLVVPYQDADAA
jgi:hypothetical protein